MSDDHSDQPAHAESVGRLASLEHCRPVDSLAGAQPLDHFLDPENLTRRVDAVAEHLARMPGDRHLVTHTSWAMGALNILGWILAPAVALAAGGVRPPAGWTDCLGCVATEDVGPFELLVRVDTRAGTEDVAAADPRVAGDSAPTGSGTAEAGNMAAASTDSASAELVDLARVLMAALHRAGCPETETLSGAAGSLGTLARQAGVSSAEAQLAREVWARLAPDSSTAPGDPEFRRPTCCGLMALARTDAACCPDCPRR